MRAGAFVVVVILYFLHLVSDDLRCVPKISEVFIELSCYGKVSQILNAVLRACRPKQLLVTFFFFILKEQDNTIQSRINYHILW